MKKILLAFLFMTLFFTLPVLAMSQEETGGGFEASQLVTLLNPVLVFLAVQLAKKITLINSTVILAVLVPGISLLGTWIIGLIVPGQSFILTLLLGLASTYVYELQKQLSGST